MNLTERQKRRLVEALSAARAEAYREHDRRMKTFILAGGAEAHGDRLSKDVRDAQDKISDLESLVELAYALSTIAVPAE